MRPSRTSVCLSVVSFAVLALIAAGQTARAQSNAGAILAVPLYGQQTNVWCWDASSLMVIKYLRPSSTLTQCAIATQATAGQNCCGSPTPSACVHTGWEMLSSNGFTFLSTNNTALSFAQLNAQITAKRPVLYGIGWSGGGGHVLVADGWFILNGTNYVDVNDPWPPTSGTSEQQTYDYWVGGPSYDHVTWADFYDILDTTTVPTLPPRPLHTIPAYRKITYVAHLALGPDPLKADLTVPRLSTQRTNQAITQLRTAPIEIIKRLGFTSAVEVAAAQLGTPLREYIVPQDKLAVYTGTNPPSSLLTGGTTFFYPVVVGGQVRSSVRLLARQGAEPVVISLGDIGTATLLRQTPSFNTLVGKRSEVSITAVRVPALGLYFLGRVVGGKLQIAPIFDVPWLQLAKGQYQDAASVFTQLAPYAKNVQGAM